MPLYSKSFCTVQVKLACLSPDFYTAHLHPDAGKSVTVAACVATQKTRDLQLPLRKVQLHDVDQCHPTPIQSSAEYTYERLYTTMEVLNVACYY